LNANRCRFFAGHSRLITNGFTDNQPIEYESVWTLHNGIILNESEIWNSLGLEPKKSVDSEVISAYFHHFLNENLSLESIASQLLENVSGTVSAIVVIPHLGKAMLLTNNGSLYLSSSDEQTYFASESYSLQKLGLANIQKVHHFLALDIPQLSQISVSTKSPLTANPIPSLSSQRIHDLLDAPALNLRRCTKCILPETMPFISFDNQGICNFCLNYTSRNSPKSLSALNQIVDTYRSPNRADCIFPMSGGRDSSFGLHLAVTELGLKPIAYTYDWGMVTDLARRNISLMCSKLKVENIIIAANIDRKRLNIRKNLLAWLERPNLGMLSLLTAGDKHFFRYIETVRRETNIDFNLWSVNPLEVTHFKSGFLGIPPDFLGRRVYQSGLSNQIHYQKNRLFEMIKNPSYFNSSIVDTLLGEYYRSRKKDGHYYHLFDYYRWDEDEINTVLTAYGWETAKDTSSTWRIGDGSAAFYNYVYFRIAGFTEHDTFRSNQIREGQISREVALAKIFEENQPRYSNIKWYLDVLGLDFSEVISRVNAIPKLELSTQHFDK
jgi:hypothetical protein